MYSNNNLVLIDFINEITSEVMININKCYMKTVKSNAEGFYTAAEFLICGSTTGLASHHRHGYS